MQYLVSVIDDGQAQASGRSDSATEAEAAAIDAFNERLQADGNWVFAGGLGDATTVDNRGESPIVTDGPFVESKEFLAGLWIMEAADFETALRLAHEASVACNRKIEVRPLLQA